MTSKGLLHLREAIAAPPLDNLPHGLKAELTKASAALSSLKPISSDVIGLAPDDCFRALRHELSAHYRALHPIVPDAGRSRAEAVVLEAFEARSRALPSLSPSGFRDRLAALNHALTDGKGGWRTGFVKLSDDRAGNQIYFPPVSEVPQQLERLRLLLAEPAEAPPLFTAAAAYLMLLNCHPFTDGNGRTARVVVNHLLRQAGMPGDVYLPIHEIARRSDGGYEIALRLAELRGDWASFLRWLLNMLACCRAIGTAGLPSDPF